MTYIVLDGALNSTHSLTGPELFSVCNTMEISLTLVQMCTRNESHLPCKTAAELDYSVVRYHPWTGG